MSLFSRALAGAGSGASEIASKYIDESIIEQRARVLDDIARRGRMQELQDTDAYTNDPDRRARMAALAGQDVIAQAGATDTATYNRARNSQLTQAQIDQTNAVTAGTGPAQAQQAGLMAKAVAAAKPIELQPGGIAFDANGRQIASNNNLTGAEASLMAYREGLKGATKQQKDDAYGALAKSIGDQLRDVQKSMNDGMAGGMMKKPPKDYDPSKPDPAVEAYLDLDKQRRILAKSQRDTIEQWHSEIRGGDGAAPTRGGKSDPLGVFGGGPASGEGATPEVFRQQAREFLDKLGRSGITDAERAQTETDLATLVREAPPGSIDLDKLKRDYKPPSATPAAPPAAPAPPASPMQRKHDEAQATARAALGEKQAAADRALQAERDQFDQDMATMAPVELLRKYDSIMTRARLSRLQLTQLNRIQRGL